MKIVIFATGLKGLNALSGALQAAGANSISFVAIGKDSNVLNDYSEDIANVCRENEIEHAFQADDYSADFDLAFAAGWQRIIKDIPSEKLIVFHDSLLPRYRGFAPLVSALLNKDTRIGVSALSGEKNYDTGRVYLQKHIPITYPIKISSAIDLISKLYFDIAKDVISAFLSGTLSYILQNESAATYSLWRDEEDYCIDWTKSAEEIAHFVDCVGYPYKGASTQVGAEKFRVLNATPLKDVTIENRTPGKVIFMDNENPVVVCGHGLLKIDEMCNEKDGLGARVKFRSRFK